MSGLGYNTVSGPKNGSELEADKGNMTMHAHAVKGDKEIRLFDPKRYQVNLHPLSADDGGGWLATIPALPGCTGDGETEMGAIEDVRLAALEWAHAATVDGDPIPAPPRTSPMAVE